MMSSYIFIVCIWYTIFKTVATIEDPCFTATLLNDDGGRSTECHLNNDGCDRYIKEDWYHVQIESTSESLTMPTTCVSLNRCGAQYPIWLNGTYPRESDGIVDLQGCVSSFDSCCKVVYTIRVKNCSDFMVFYLTKAKGCSERYCFGASEHCELTTPDGESTTPFNVRTTSTTKTSTYEHDNHPNNKVFKDSRVDSIILVLVLLSVAMVIVIVVVAGGGLVILRMLKCPKVHAIDSSKPPPYDSVQHNKGF